tara:strand:+ start:887 stop:1072 length:186 start_codon:yes stop_codon:yes gene_type:complete
MQKKEYNKKIIGKIATILDPKTGNQWSGTVVDVLNDETVLVQELRSSHRKEVDLYDIQNTN